MVNSGHYNQKLPFALLVVLRRVSMAIVAIISLRACMLFFGEPVDAAHYALMTISALLALILFRGKTSDDVPIGHSFWSVSLSVFSRWLLLFAALLALAYATKTSTLYSRKLLFTWLLVTPPMLLLTRLAIDHAIMRMVIASNHSRRIVIAGANELGRNLAEKLKNFPQYGMAIDGFFDDRSAERLGSDSSIRIIGKLPELPDYVRKNNIDLIFIVLPMRNIERVTEILDQLHDTTASIYFVPDVFVFDLIQCRTGDIDGMPIVALCETPFHGMRGIVKQTSDYIIASAILLITSPLLLAIALAIKLTTPGNVIFKQRRYGLDGHEIIVYKFRTMTVSEDADSVRQATKGDSRITKVGAILRRYSLDELPQFINVLQGRMSVVGPRPHAVAHNEEYRPLIKGYMVRHKVNPGITGLAQVQGFRGETKSVEDMKNRVDCDLEYLRNWTLALDLKIIARTVNIMFSDKMAY
jgi:putative colanic acid biosysnthesis UDP-glucose lipid carrier transferase